MNRICYIVLCSLLLCFASCERKELTYDYHPYCSIMVDVDWDNLPGYQPNGVSVVFYPKNGGTPVKVESNDYKQVSIDVRAGVYDILVFNNIPSDFHRLGFRGIDKLETFEIYSIADDENRWCQSKADDEFLAFQPETFACAIVRNFEVTQEMVSRSMEARSRSAEIYTTDIKVKPDPVVKNIGVHVHVSGIHNVRSMRSTINGLAYSYNLNNGTVSQNNVTIPLTEWHMTKDEGSYTEGVFTTSLSCLGVANDPKLSAQLQMSFLLVDNKTVVNVSRDITEKLKNWNFSEVVVLHLNVAFPTDGEEPIIIPDVKPEGGSEGGFDADVGDWGEEVNADVPI